MTPVLGTTTMTTYLQAVLATLQAHDWPSPLSQVGYRAPDLALDEEQVIKTPALLLNVAARSVETAPAIDIPGRRPRRCSLELYGLLSVTTPNLALELLELSDAILSLIERREHLRSPQVGHRWNLSTAVDFPENIADRDADQLQLNGIAARVVTWDQVIYVPELEPLA